MRRLLVTLVVLAPALAPAGCDSGPPLPTATAPAARWGAPEGGPEGLVGLRLSPFEITDLQGDVITLDKLRGKVVLLDFWAAWCNPCRAASPVMQRLHDKYRNDGLVVIGVNVGEGKAVAAQYAAEHRYTYTFAYDTDILKYNCGVRSLPAFIVADKEGVVRYAEVGWRSNTTERDLEKAIREALAK